MNKRYRINSGILLVFILALGFLTACKGGKKAPDEDELKPEIPQDNPRRHPGAVQPGTPGRHRGGT